MFFQILADIDSDKTGIKLKPTWKFSKPLTMSKLNKWIFTTWTNTDGTSGILRSSASITYEPFQMLGYKIYSLRVTQGTPARSIWELPLSYKIQVEVYVRNLRHSYNGVSWIFFFPGDCVLDLFQCSTENLEVLQGSTYRNVLENCRRVSQVCHNVITYFLCFLL